MREKQEKTASDLKVGDVCYGIDYKNKLHKYTVSSIKEEYSEIINNYHIVICFEYNNSSIHAYESRLSSTATIYNNQGVVERIYFNKEDVLDYLVRMKENIDNYIKELSK